MIRRCEDEDFELIWAIITLPARFARRLTT